MEDRLRRHDMHDELIGSQASLRRTYPANHVKFLILKTWHAHCLRCLYYMVFCIMHVYNLKEGLCWHLSRFKAPPHAPYTQE